MTTFIPGTLIPRTAYKYLGVWIFNSSPADGLMDYLKRKITSYFTQLSALPLAPGEIIILINRQLIPIILYRMLAHPLNETQLTSLQSFLWSKTSHACHVPLYTSPKDRFLPRSQGGLGLRCLRLALACQDLSYSQRFWLSQGPIHPCTQIQKVLFSSEPSPLLNTLVDACYFLGLRAHHFGPWNPCLPGQLFPQEKVYV